MRTDKLSRDEIKSRFDRETASAYSGRDCPWLPDFSAMFGLVSRLVHPYLLKTPDRNVPRVLDLGAGTGNLSRTVLESIPDVHCTLMDFSPNMLAEAPHVLASFPGRFELVEADFSQADLGDEVHDAVISSFAIHHMRSEDEYGALYRRIFRSLKTPGIFLCCDVVSGAAPFLSAINEDDWVSFLRSGNFRENDIERILSNYRVEDSPISVGAHATLLHRAGFALTDVAWKRANFAVYIGIKDLLAQPE